MNISGPYWARFVFWLLMLIAILCTAIYTTWQVISYRPVPPGKGRKLHLVETETEEEAV